ncbi:MAG: hypothetical protein N2738_05620 [Thermodesulfovibrionales bacterium]|nr:hypothetical protein [Thermodesulfovibrionales bacterium]
MDKKTERITQEANPIKKAFIFAFISKKTNIKGQSKYRIMRVSMLYISLLGASLQKIPMTNAR